MCLHLRMESNNLGSFTANGVTYVYNLVEWQTERTVRQARSLHEMAQGPALPNVTLRGTLNAAGGGVGRNEFVTFQPQNPVHLIMGENGFVAEPAHTYPHPDWKPKNISQLATIKHGKA